MSCVTSQTVGENLPQSEGGPGGQGGGEGEEKGPPRGRRRGGRPPLPGRGCGQRRTAPGRRAAASRAPAAGRAGARGLRGLPSPSFPPFRLGAGPSMVCVVEPVSPLLAPPRSSSSSDAVPPPPPSVFACERTNQERRIHGVYCRGAAQPPRDAEIVESARTPTIPLSSPTKLLMPTKACRSCRT